MTIDEARIDPIAAVRSADPADRYGIIAAERSLTWHPELRLWIAAHPDTVRSVLASPDCRVRPLDQPIPAHLTGTPAGAVFGRFARMRDGDDHRPSRRAIARVLSDLDLEAVQAATVRQAAEMPEADLDRYVFALPVRAIGAMLGCDDADLDALASWTTALVGCVHPSASSSEIDAGIEAAVELGSLFARLLRSAEPPVMLAAIDDAFREEGLTTDDAVANAIGLLFQAHDAAAGLIGNAIVDLARRPDAVREPMVAVIERVARQDPSVHNTRRFVARDTVIAGQHLVAGDTILVVLAAAGMMEPERRWTFGYGAHACPGESIALTIATVAIESLARRGAIPTRLPARMRYCPLANVRIPEFSPAQEELP